MIQRKWVVLSGLRENAMVVMSNRPRRIEPKVNLSKGPKRDIRNGQFPQLKRKVSSDRARFENMACYWLAGQLDKCFGLSRRPPRPPHALQTNRVWNAWWASMWRRKLLEVVKAFLWVQELQRQTNSSPFWVGWKWKFCICFHKSSLSYNSSEVQSIQSHFTLLWSEEISIRLWLTVILDAS